jgi:putative transposase
MRRYEISEQKWEKIKDKLPCQPGYQGKRVDNRLFINAVMFVAKCGIPWRDLPERFGNWNSVYIRFRRWARKGVWQKVFKEMADREITTLLIDSTAIRVHQHASGALKKQRTKQQQTG